MIEITAYKCVIFFQKTKTVLKNVATCLFDNWILGQNERQGGQVRQTHCTVALVLQLEARKTL